MYLALKHWSANLQKSFLPGYPAQVTFDLISVLHVSILLLDDKWLRGVAVSHRQAAKCMKNPFITKLIIKNLLAQLNADC